MEKTDIVDRYWTFLLTEGARPKSVYAFAVALGIEESEFYESFAGLAAIEGEYWKQTVVETIDVVEADEDFVGYPADQKLLAFFFTYITHIQKQRSRFVTYFPKLGALSDNGLTGMKEVLRGFAKSIVASGVEDGTFADRKKLTDYYDSFIWMHFLAVIRFYIQDESEGFQDTDAFIEKSVHVGVQSAAHGVLESGLDFARFMIGKDDRLKGLGKIISKFIPE